MKIVSRCLLLLTLFCSLFKVDNLQAEISFDHMPADLDQVDIYLHTVDLGNLVFNNFGHLALRVRDKVSGRDLVFNWGLFEFKDPLTFGLNFYRGILIYKLGIYPYRQAVEVYQYERRKVWEDKLELTREEKAKLLTKLIWNSKPENRGYPYQYFFDNCSTRIRDYLDEAMGGVVQRTAQLQYTPQTFRDMVYDGYSYTPGMDLFLDIALNSNVDRLMTIWERMFHPINLREVYLQHQSGDRPFLSESRIIAEFPRPESYPGLSFILVLLVFGVPLSLIGVAFFLQKRSGQAFSYVYRLFGLISLPLLSFGALIGLLIPVTWLVSAHVDLHHNANILLFWPLDFILLAWALAIIVQGRGWSLSEKKIVWLRNYALLHMIVTLLMPILRILGIIEQNVDRVMVWVLPPYMVILFLLWRVGTQLKKSRVL